MPIHQNRFHRDEIHTKMRATKLLFVPLFFLICLAVVHAEESPNTPRTKVESYKPPSNLANYFQGEIRQHLERLFRVNWEHLKHQDELAEVQEKLEETQKILSYKKALFDKEKEAGIRRQEYITKLRTAYERWEELEQHLKYWTRIEESIPTKLWTSLEKGPEVLQKIQQAKSQVETQMREVEAEHNVYASRKEKLEKGGETLQQTHDKVKEETLSKLQSTIKTLKAEAKDISEKLETGETFRQSELNVVAQVWIDDTKDDGVFFNIIDRTIIAFTPKEETGKLASLQPTLLKQELNDKFKKAMASLVAEYEENIKAKTAEEHDDDDVSKIRQELAQYTINFKKQENYLGYTRYSLVNPKLAKNPLQDENAVIDVIETILKRDPKYLTKWFAGKVKTRAELLRAVIANNSACKVNTNINFSRGVSNAALRFKSEVHQAIQLALTPLDRDFVLKQIKKAAEKQHRNLQSMMDVFSKIEQCAQTWRRIEYTLKKIDLWTKQM